MSLLPCLMLGPSKSRLIVHLRCTGTTCLRPSRTACRSLGGAGVAYAISHEAAAQRLIPFLSSVAQVRLRLLPDRAAEAALLDLGARSVTEGANLAIIESKSAGELLFRERQEGLWLASPIQIYLDLIRGEGRSKEMAEHFRKERIGF